MKIKKIKKSLSYILLPVMVLFTFQSAFAGSYRSQRSVNRGQQQSNYHLHSLTINNSQLTINTNPFKYSGYYQDTESGLYYLNARYYSPELMRFINRDTYDLSNRYAYCNGNPISNTDSSGHMPKWLGSVVACVGTIIGLYCSGVVDLPFRFFADEWGCSMLADSTTAGSTAYSYFFKKQRSGAASLILGLLSASCWIYSGFELNEKKLKNLRSLVESTKGEGRDMLDRNLEDFKVYRAAKIKKCDDELEVLTKLKNDPESDLSKLTHYQVEYKKRVIEYSSDDGQLTKLIKTKNAEKKSLSDELKPTMAEAVHRNNRIRPDDKEYLLRKFDLICRDSE
jgi:RHS repeat-associated protein